MSYQINKTSLFLNVNDAPLLFFSITSMPLASDKSSLSLTGPEKSFFFYDNIDF